MTTPTIADLVPGVVIQGSILPEPVEIVATVPVGTSVKLMGKGLKTGLFHGPILSPEQVAQLTLTPKDLPFDGDAAHFRLGIEAHRLGLAYEYDPYFSLSIGTVIVESAGIGQGCSVTVRLPRMEGPLLGRPIL